MAKNCLQCKVELPWIMGPNYCDRCATAEYRKDLGLGFTGAQLRQEQFKAPSPERTQCVPVTDADTLARQLARIPGQADLPAPAHPLPCGCNVYAAAYRVFRHEDCPICLKHNFLAALGALGYAMPGTHNGDFTDGRHPENGIAKALDRQVTELREKLAAAEANASFLRESVGECHMMISRNATEFQVRSDWDNTTLPFRLRTNMRECDEARAEVRRLREQVAALKEEAIDGSQCTAELVDAAWRSSTAKARQEGR